MYLKALEIQGFKSFPDKTVLTFGEDITAFVGPNGSGKSNISDAIRWVMGEQSTRALRGGKMEDVIFGGTAKRRQTGYAEVSLVLDNTSHLFDLDESEVMVTRRYYRSGESEYYINRRSVRLKDINELFMDTGLGREGYSIIGQGKIDEILSVKSEDRREVFEEAAGISRYRHRKEEAERKLERTDENLVRGQRQDRRAGAPGGAPPGAEREGQEVPGPPGRAAGAGDLGVAGHPGPAAGQQHQAGGRLSAGGPDPGRGQGGPGEGLRRRGGVLPADAGQGHRGRPPAL